MQSINRRVAKYNETMRLNKETIAKTGTVSIGANFQFALYLYVPL